MIQRVQAIILDMSDLTRQMKEHLERTLQIPHNTNGEANVDIAYQWVIRHLFLIVYNIPSRNHNYRASYHQQVFHTLKMNFPAMENIFWNQTSDIVRYWHPLNDAEIFCEGTSVYLIDINDIRQ